MLRGLLSSKSRTFLAFAITLLTLFVSSVAVAEWQSIDEANPASPTTVGMTIVKSDTNSTIVKYHVYGVDTEKVLIDNQEYTKVLIPGLSLSDQKGLPELPRLSRNILIPASSQATLRIVSMSKVERDFGVVVPSKGPMTRDIDPTTVPYVFDAFYSGDEAFPKVHVALNEPFVMRSTHGVTVDFYPVQYDNFTKMTYIVTDITVEILTATPSSKRLEVFEGPKVQDEAFMSLYQNHFANYVPFTSSKDINPAHFVKEKGRILVISHADFAAAMVPFVNWKRQQGYLVKLVTLADTGSTYQNIKTYIQNEYTTNDIGYVILVGSAKHVPYFPGTAGNVKNKEADPMYGLVAGNDNYPDLFVSRMSVKTTADVDTIVAKTINYEKNPDLEGSWYNRATGIASSEGSPTDFERAEILRKMLEGWHYVNTDKFYDPGATASQVTTALNQGRSFINYIGHGSKTSWGTTGFSNSDIDALSNGAKLPFIVSVACVNGQFGQGTTDSFAERWLKAGTAQQAKGAIAVFASSTNQAWVPPTVGQKEINNILVKRQANTIGGLFTNGVIAVLEENSSDAAQTFQSWHTFGDASLQVRTQKPLAIKVQMPEALPIGTGDIKLNAGEKGIALGVVQDGKLVARGVSGDDGLIVAKPTEALKDGEALITLTGFDKIPNIATVIVK